MRHRCWPLKPSPGCCCSRFHSCATLRSDFVFSFSRPNPIFLCRSAPPPTKTKSQESYVVYIPFMWQLLHGSYSCHPTRQEPTKPKVVSVKNKSWNATKLGWDGFDQPFPIHTLTHYIYIYIHIDVPYTQMITYP